MTIGHGNNPDVDITPEEEAAIEAAEAEELAQEQAEATARAATTEEADRRERAQAMFEDWCQAAGKHADDEVDMQAEFYGAMGVAV